MRFSYFAATLICCSAFTASLASATIVSSDDFSTNGVLVGSTPDVGGAWATNSGGGTNDLTVVGQQLPFTTNGHDARTAFSSSVAHTDGDKVYSGIDINLSAAQANGDYFFHLSDGGTSLFWQRLFARSSDVGFQLGISGGNGTVTYGTDVMSFSTPYHVAISWSFVAGALNDTFNLYVDPTSDVEGSNTAYLASADWGGGSAEPAVPIAGSNIRQGSAGNAPTGIVDNLIVATTFAEVAAVAAVPEPSAVLFGALVCGVIGLVVGGKRLKTKLSARG